MIRANKLTQLEGPRNVGEFGKNWRFWRNFAKAVNEMIRANKLTQLEGPRNVGEFGGNGEFGDLTK